MGEGPVLGEGGPHVFFPLPLPPVTGLRQRLLPAATCCGGPAPSRGGAPAPWPHVAPVAPSPSGGRAHWLPAPSLRLGGRGPDSSQRGCRTSRPPVHESGPPPVPESGPAPRPSPAPVPPRPVPEPPARYRRSATPSPFPGSPRHRYRPALCGSPRPIPRIEPGHPLPPIPARYRHRLRTQAGMGVGGFWGTRGHLGRHGRAWGDMVGLGGTEGHGGIRGHLGGTWGLWGFGRHRDMGGHGDIWGGFGGQVIMGGVQGTWWYYEHG